jgi:hypothetical protein
MVDITFSVDERVAVLASKAALAMGKNLNQMVIDYLKHLAGEQQFAGELSAFEISAINTPGRLEGWKWNRDDANSR